MIGTRLHKPLQDETLALVIEKEDGTQFTKYVPNDAPNTYRKYAELADWCNQNNAVILEREDYYEAVATPEPTAEELEMEALRQELDERERYLSETDYKIIKCVEQGLDLEAEYPGLKALRQSARDRINEIRDTLGTTE